MCSTDYGMLDLLFDKDEPSKTMSDSFRNTMFTSDKFIQDPNLVKEEVMDSGIAQNIDWKMNTDWDADELLRSVLDGDVNSSMASISSLDFNKSFSQVLNTSSKPSPTLSSYPNLTQVATPTLQTPRTIMMADDMDAIENLVGLPFHAVMEQNHEPLDLPMDSSASDSGLSSIDQQFSPHGYSVGSPDSSVVDLGSPSHTLDGTMSDVSSTSDLGSLMSLSTVPGSPTSSYINTTPNSPDHMPINGSSLIDPLGLDSGFSSPASSVSSVVSPNGSHFTNSSVSPMVIPISTAAVRLAHAPVTVVNSSAALPTQTVTVPVTQQQAPTVLKTVLGSSHYTSNSTTIPGQTIVVTQASKGGQPTAHLVRGGTFLKTNNSSRSILLPVNVKDLNQVRTIKIISTGGNGTNVTNGRAVRTVVSTVRPTVTTSGSSTINTPVRAATLLSRDTKSLLKGATVVTTRPSLVNTTTSLVNTTTSSIGIKEELYDDDDDDEPDPLQNTFQQIVLSDEEKRLLKKEGIQLPSHYPLTKQEERELKRIRRKIRNKISAQDSRKRKKEYIDGLEDRVKACTDENQQLQKRIRTLEQQNDNLLSQMRRFQSMVANGISGSGRSHTHASTAIMMLVLSAALFIVPSLRPQDANDKELTMPSSKMPSGHTRSLLVAPGSTVVPTTLEGLEEVEEEILDGEQLTISALNDHDYAPPAKKLKFSTLRKKDIYYNPPIDDELPRKGQTDDGGGGMPLDDDPPIGKLSAKIMNILDNSLVNNISDTGGQTDNSRSIVVNLHNKTKFNRIRDDLELE